MMVPIYRLNVLVTHKGYKIKIPEFEVSDENMLSGAKWYVNKNRIKLGLTAKYKVEVLSFTVMGEEAVPSRYH